MQGIRYNGAQSWGTNFVATSATGSTFVNLNEEIADEVTLVLPSSGVGLDVLCAGQVQEPTKFVSIDAPSGFVIPLTGNAKEVMVRRTDLSNTPINVRYTWRKFRR